MNYIDRLWLGTLVLGVWVLVAMQFFGGMTASAAAPQRGDSRSRPLYVEVVNGIEVDFPSTMDVWVNNYPTEVRCANCD
jgi:hypothetical protein